MTLRDSDSLRLLNYGLSRYHRVLVVRPRERFASAGLKYRSEHVELVAILPFRLGGKTTVFTALGMIQIGEFSYVLARAGREVGALSETLNGLILTSSLLTIILTPGAFRIAPRVAMALPKAECGMRNAE